MHINGVYIYIELAKHAWKKHNQKLYADQCQKETKTRRRSSLWIFSEFSLQNASKNCMKLLVTAAFDQQPLGSPAVPKVLKSILRIIGSNFLERQ
jgi:hypothetical protein